MVALLVSKNSSLHCSYVDLPREEEGLDMNRSMDTPLYFYQVLNYQPQKKA